VNKPTMHQKQLEAYQAANLEAARTIASDPVKYPPDSLPGIWARMVLTPSVEGTAPTPSGMEIAIRQ